VQRVAGDDDELLRRLRDGDEAAFLHLVNLHQRAMRRVARTFVATDAHADEVVQDTWLGVLKGLRTFEGRSSLRTWIFTILKNQARTKGKREARQVPTEALDGEPSVPRDRFRDDGHWAQGWTHDAHKQLEEHEARATINEALARLPALQRAVVTLRDVEGWDADEVCNALDLTEVHQRVLLHRARAQVRAALVAKGQGPAPGATR
jgi:RNA polymerase sigma-70 factor (ECF subfamily)